jgi:hypothetical protein
MKNATLYSTASLAALLASCTVQDHGIPVGSSEVVLKSYSKTPSLVKAMPGFENLEIFPLIGSDDTLSGSPSFVFGAQPDGAGLLKEGDGYVLINNHEILQSVSRVYLDKTFKPTKGEYIVNGEGGIWRLCSASMATPQEHGFGPMFLTAGESGAESMIHAIDPLGMADPKNNTRTKPALGKASMENAVPLPKDAYAGKTVVIIGEDNGDGQVLAYVSNTVGDLDNGKLYFLRQKSQDPVETNLEVGKTYEVEFVEVDNPKTQTGAQIAAQSVTKKAIQFARVEDVDYRKGGGANSREVFFVSTGVANTPGKTMWGRLYQLNMDAADPLKGTLTVLADGAKDPGNDLINPDNVCATENYVYVQEDGDSYYPAAKHDSWIWQYSLATKTYKPWLTMDHRRTNTVFNAKYNTTNNNRFGSWEFGAMYDISTETGQPGTFLVNIHPHTWTNPRFLSADGSGVIKNSEGGQVVIIRNVQK